MSAIATQNAELVCSVMQAADLSEVLAIENRVYSHPWTLGNFEDSLNSAYYARLLRDGAQRLLGYFLVMPVVDEAHLLNLSVDLPLQHRGYGQWLMREAVNLARLHNLQTMLLEVRVSNRHALSFYSRYGFQEIGRRKNYYPVADSRREDAIMMTMPL
ncbi:MAG TPA: ribosomal protein S18-alanine N-acetyltransferase [Herbaspirillum sp.]|jgi:ribosomal-protein-alanine N-acetyltransferase